jgi:transcriptional regulator with XRE-family HTH domain
MVRNNEYLRDMGAKIKAIRKSKKITLRKLGEMCELDYGQICRIETGQMNSRICSLYRIAQRLNVDIKEFF